MKNVLKRNHFKDEKWNELVSSLIFYDISNEKEGHKVNFLCDGFLTLRILFFFFLSSLANPFFVVSVSQKKAAAFELFPFFLKNK